VFASLGNSDDSDSFNDPAGWNSASYVDDPIDHIEPLDIPANVYREASIRHLSVSYVTDTFMSRQTNGVRGWIVVSIVLGYPSTQGRTLTSIAEEMGVTKQALSRSCTQFSRMLGLPTTAFGMKSAADRLTYMRTNGHRRADDVEDTDSELSIGDFPPA
jgi:hypothetical protein